MSGFFNLSPKYISTKKYRDSRKLGVAGEIKIKQSWEISNTRARFDAPH